MKKNYSSITIVFLIIACLAAFGRIGGNDFINFDDEGYITENDHIKSGIHWGSIKWAFKTVVLSNWVPLALISHMLDWSLFGQNASGHHLMSLLWHIGAVIFLFLFLQKTTGNIWSAAFASAFFAVHPLRVESVAWASERKDVLSMFFGMASLWAYAFYAQKQKISSYLVCLMLFVLSLLSKSMLLTLPFVFLLLDYWPLKRWEKEATANKNIFFSRLIWEKIPFIILTIISSAITFWVQYEPNAVYPSFAVRIFNAAVAYAVYLGKTFWPADLALNYFFAYSFNTWQITASFIVLILITTVVIYQIKKKPFLFVGWFWYLGTLVPVIGLVPTNTLTADHYTYLPSIGIAVMMSWGIGSLLKREEARRRILVPVSVLVLAILIVMTWQQCGYWKNGVELWNHALRVTKNNYLAHHNMGSLLFKKGKAKEALYHFDRSIHINPNNRSYNARGDIYARAGRYKQALDDFSKAISLNIHEADGYYNRGLTYDRIGQYHLAIADFDKAISLKNDYVNAYNGRGIVYAKLGKYQPAIEDFTKAISIKPDFALAYSNRSISYFSQGRSEPGCTDARKACELENCSILQAAKGKGVCH